MRRFLIAGFALIGLAVPASAQCMKSNTAKQIVEERLTIANAQDSAGRPERPYILHLPVAACIEGTDPEDKVARTRTIHVYSLDNKIGAALRRFVGKSMLVRGKPVPQHTAHHHAPIVME